MSLPGTPAHQTPRGDDWWVRELQDLKRRLQQLTTARSTERATIGRGGITVTEGGSLRVVDVDGTTIAIIGALPESYNRLDGSPQPGIVLYREDGTLAALLGDGNPAVLPYKQSWQVYDREGSVVVADDTNSGHGLATPWVLAERPVDTNATTWPATTNTAWTDIATCYVVRQNAKLLWAIYTQADPSTTGQFRVQIDGVTVATSPTVTGGFALWSVSYAWPAGWDFLSSATFTIQAQRTAGAGIVRAETLQLTGTQS